MTHFVIFSVIVFDRRENAYTKMDNLSRVQTPRGRRPPTNVRRNLFTEFNECPSPEIDRFSTPETEVLASPLPQENRSDGWLKVMLFWIAILALMVVFIGSVFRSFLDVIVLWIMKNIIFVCALFVLCIILIGLVYRSCAGVRRSQRPRNAINSDVFSGRSANIQVKRTFSGDGTTIWSEFERYFENVSNINHWPMEQRRSVLLTTLRGQAETYAYGLPESILHDYGSLSRALNERFGHTALKESYLAEAKLRKKKDSESFRDFGQAIEDLYRSAHPGNREFVEENSLKTFLDNCSPYEDFRLAVKRTRPKKIQEAITSAMQEECIRVRESESSKPGKQWKRDIYTVRLNERNSENTANAPILPNQVVKRKCYECGSDKHLRNCCPRIVRRSSQVADRSNPQGNDLPPRQ